MNQFAAFRTCFDSFLAALLLGPALAVAQPADMIVVNAKIATLDSVSTMAQAMAVRDGRVMAVGAQASMRQFAGPATRTVDAGGRTVIPGLIDSHIHAAIHWGENASVGHLLDLYEQVNRETPITGLRWSIAHLDNGSPETFARMKALGMGWTMQDAMYFSGDRFLRTAGEAARRMPPILTALRAGVNVGAGTDAHRVASYNPFVALQWMLDGKTVSGQLTRGPEETPSRDAALRLYTLGSAWFSFDEARRGSLEVGKLADFAVLDQDFFSVPLERVARTVSLMTVVGGKVVYAAPPFEVPG